MLFLRPDLCIHVFHSLPSLDYNFPWCVWGTPDSRDCFSYLSQCPVQSPARARGCRGGCKDQLSPLLCLSPNQARNSCPGPVDSSAFLNSDFLLPEDPKPKLPPPPVPPPLLQYPALAKGPGLEPCPPPAFPPMGPPPALLQEEPLFSPRFPFSTVPPAPGVSPLPAPTAFPPTPQPGPGPAPAPFPIDLLPSGYLEPPFGPHFTVPQGMRPRGRPPTPCPRGRKPSPPTLAPANPTATAGGSNPCLTQLLTAGEMGRTGSTEGKTGTKCGSGGPVGAEGEGLRGRLRLSWEGVGGGEELGMWALNLKEEWASLEGRDGVLGDDGVEAGPSGPHTSARVQPSPSRPWNHHLCPAPSSGPQGPR